MWQLAWMWNLIPTAVITWFVNGLIVLGLIGISASWIARWIPGVAAYRGIAQLVGVVALVLGVYFKGGADVEMKWRTQVAELQARVDQAQAESKLANQRLSDEIRRTQQLTKDVKNATKTSISANAKKMDSQCRVDDVAIQLHNSASRNEIPRSTTGTVTVVPGVGTDVPPGPRIK